MRKKIFSTRQLKKLAKKKQLRPKNLFISGILLTFCAWFVKQGNLPAFGFWAVMFGIHNVYPMLIFGLLSKAIPLAIALLNLLKYVAEMGLYHLEPMTTRRLKFKF